MSFLCAGCCHTFDRQANFLQHLRKTQRPKCIQFHQELEAQTHQRNSLAGSDGEEEDKEPEDDEEGTEEIFMDVVVDEADKEEQHAKCIQFHQELEAQTHQRNSLAGSNCEEEDEEPEDDEEGTEEILMDMDLSRVGNVVVNEADEEEQHAEDDEGAAEGAARMDVDPPHREPSDPPYREPGPSRVYIDHFGGRSGEIIDPPASNPSASVRLYVEYNALLEKPNDRYGNAEPEETNRWAPFVSQIDWELARWAKLRGPSSTAFSDLLAIPRVHERLGLTYKNSMELNKIIDTLPSPRPAFVHHQVEVAGEVFNLFSRDILECIQALYGNPEHSQYLCFQPERHYSDADKAERVYHDMHTGKWWWSTQAELEKRKPGATVIPIILSSDKTQLTLFRNKTAYPVYLTIGNLPKSIRRKSSKHGQILLAYLPTTRLTHISNKSARRCALANLFHACMGQIVAPLREAGTNGISIVSGDGVCHRGHPILASYIGDYPEQCFVTGVYNRDCPTCECPHEELGDNPCNAPLRDPDAIMDVLEQIGLPSYSTACREARIKPLQRPFWADLPFVNIFQSITPDILHQLYQGVVKHLVSWLTAICGAAEIDARVSKLPPNPSGKTSPG